MDLSTLRRQADRLLRLLAEAERDRLLGLTLATNFHSIFKDFQSLASSESFACAREAFSSAAEADKPAARALLDLSATALEHARTASFDAERLAFGSRAKVVVQGSAVPLREVPRRLANEPTREVRSAFEHASSGAIASLDSLLSRRVEACQDLASELGFPGYEALRAFATGVDLAALAVEAEATLKATDDAWRDLFAFGLRRVVSQLELQPRGEAAAHDLARFERLEPLDDVFKVRRLLGCAQALLEGMGLSPDARGRISVDAEDQGARPGGGACLAVDPPDEVSVVLGRRGGALDFSALFHALGSAHFFAAESPELRPEHRRLGEEALPAAFGNLFDRLLAEDAFLRRALDADPKEAIEAARFVAIVRLGELRRACAELLFQRTLWAEGPREELRGLSREWHQKALAVSWPVERWLWDLTPRFAPATALRGFALAEALRRGLLEAADEDWWRNPRAGAFLQRIAARGGSVGAEGVAETLKCPFSLSSSAQALVRVAAR